MKLWLILFVPKYILSVKPKKYNEYGQYARIGNGLDNAGLKKFFSHFKAECFKMYSFCKTKEVQDINPLGMTLGQNLAEWTRDFNPGTPMDLKQNQSVYSIFIDLICGNSFKRVYRSNSSPSFFNFPVIL